MTYETEPSLNQAASPSANGVKKVWSRPELNEFLSVNSDGGPNAPAVDGQFLAGNS